MEFMGPILGLGPSAVTNTTLLALNVMRWTMGRASNRTADQCQHVECVRNNCNRDDPLYRTMVTADDVHLVRVRRVDGSARRCALR